MKRTSFELLVLRMFLLQLSREPRRFTLPSLLRATDFHCVRRLARRSAMARTVGGRGGGLVQDSRAGPIRERGIQPHLAVPPAPCPACLPRQGLPLHALTRWHCSTRALTWHRAARVCLRAAAGAACALTPTTRAACLRAGGRGAESIGAGHDGAQRWSSAQGQYDVRG